MQAIWQQRLERADELARQSQVEPDVLDFYRHIASFQASLAEGARPANLHLLEALADRTDDDPLHAFFRRVLHVTCLPTAPPQPGRCPICAKPPVATVLQGGRRVLLCGLCFHRWEHAGTQCLACGGETTTILPDETAKEFPYIAIEACQACRTYLKAIGYGSAAPEVDELASVIVDLWAVAQGFSKLQTNLFGL